MLERDEIYIREVIKHNKHKGLSVLALKGFLRLLSWAFRFGVYARNRAFDKGWFRRYHPPVPLVISVGNVVAGGTGKTPIVQFISKKFIEKHPLAILSRGYRSPAEKLSEPILLCKGSGPIYPASFSGDEPYLLAQNIPSAFVYVGKDRQKASMMASQAGAQIIILDDGMQHRQLGRDIEVVVINGNDPLGCGYFLPRGFLRDSLRSLSRADLIVINHARNEDYFASIKKKIQKYSDAPCVGMEMVPTGLKDIHGYTIDSLKNVKVGIFCGIANPEQFKSLVEKEEAFIIDEYFIPDHRTPKQETLIHFAERCARKGATYLLCTEKDKVKLSKEWKGALPIIWVKAEMNLIAGKDHWEAFMNKAEKIIESR